MQQRIFLKITFKDGLNALASYRKLVERHGQNALGYHSVTYWRCEVRGRRKDVEDCPKCERPPDFGIGLRVARASEDLLNVPVRRIAEITGYEPSTMFSMTT
jgi:hypothetical protein